MFKILFTALALFAGVLMAHSANATNQLVIAIGGYDTVSYHTDGKAV